MTTNHTAGPWGIHTFYQKLEIHPADDEDGMTVIADLTFGDTETRAQCEFNARLIAEAPAILEALREFVDLTASSAVFHGAQPASDAKDLIREARAILARIDADNKGE